jgi:lambda family phage portal protein
MGWFSNIFGGGKRDTNPAANRSRQLQAMQRRMLTQAAQQTRLEAGWTGTPESADGWIQKNLRTVVARSRHQATENDYARKFVAMVRNNVVGPTGIRLRSTPRDANGKIDQAAKDAIEEAWRVQSRPGNWEVTGTMSRAMFERLWIGGCAIDGSAIAVVVTGPDAGPSGFGLQIIDTMRLDPQHNEQLGGGRFIRHGIEFNSVGRPLAYHFIEEDPTLPLYAVGYYGRTYQRIDASRVIHAFIPELVGQRRGIPWMTTALWRMRNLKGFEDAAVVNARIGAAKMGFFHDPNGEMGEDDLPMDAEPGTFENIGGLKFESWNPQFPEQSTEQFVRTQLRGIASGICVSYNGLASDLTSVNFSSLRDGKNDERDTWRILQEWMIDTFERPVFDLWVERAVLAGSIRIRNNPLRVTDLDKYKSAEFKGRRWAWVDPQADVAAAKMAVEARLASRTKYIEEWNEGDAWDTFEQIAQEEDDMEELGVEIMTTPGAGVIGNEAPKSTEKET